MKSNLAKDAKSFLLFWIRRSVVKCHHMFLGWLLRNWDSRITFPATYIHRVPFFSLPSFLSNLRMFKEGALERTRVERSFPYLLTKLSKHSDSMLSRPVAAVPGVWDCCCLVCSRTLQFVFSLLFCRCMRNFISDKLQSLPVLAPLCLQQQ